MNKWYAPTITMTKPTLPKNVSNLFVRFHPVSEPGLGKLSPKSFTYCQVVIPKMAAKAMAKDIRPNKTVTARKKIQVLSGTYFRDNPAVSASHANEGPTEAAICKFWR